MKGHTLAETRWRGTRLALVRHAPGLWTTPHDHACACLHIIQRGVYVEHSELGTRVACAGDVVFKGVREPHWNRFGTTGAESLRFELDPGSDERLLAVGASLDSFDLSWALGLARELRAGGDVSGAPGRRTKSPQSALLLRLRRDYRTPLRLREVARELGVHRSHLTRQFTREFGCSPRDYVALRRTAWVAEQLALGSGSASTLAVSAGFVDQSHLIRVFKRVLGSTPVKWCRQTRQ